MLYYDRKVPVPNQVKLYKQGKNTYVYFATNTRYVSEKKYNIEERCCIGRLIDKTKMMIPNDSYFLHFGNEKVELYENNNLYCDSISIGNIIALKKGCIEIGLSKIIDDSFPQKSDLIKSLCYFSICSQSSTMQEFPAWAFENMHELDAVPSLGTISNLFNQYLKANKISDFIFNWVKHSTTSIEDPIMLLLDSTNMNTHSSSITHAERGMAKVDEGLPQINIAYAVNHNNGLPVFYDVYPGSIPDVAQCKLLIQKASDYEMHNLCFILDRGYFSQSNIDYLQKHEYNFIIMCRHDIQGFRKAFDEYSNVIKNNAKYYISGHQIYGVSFESKLTSESSQKHNCYFFYDDQRAAFERGRYNSMVEELINSLKNVKTLTPEILNSYGRYVTFKTGRNNSIVEMTINLETQQEAYDNAGFFMIASTNNEGIGSVLSKYRNRDVIEKVFMGVKSFLGGNKFYSSTDAAVEAKTFLTFLSSIIRAYFLRKMKPYTRSHSDQSVNSILAELRKIKATKINGIYRRNYALTNKQKEILSYLEIEEIDIDNMIKSVNKKTLKDF